MTAFLVFVVQVPLPVICLGIYCENVEAVLDAGANIIVSGSGVFKGNITENTKRFMEILKRHE